MGNFTFFLLKKSLIGIAGGAAAPPPPPLDPRLRLVQSVYS